MTDDLSAVLARIGTLQQTLGIQPAATDSSSSSAFDAELAAASDSSSSSGAFSSNLLTGASTATAATGSSIVADATKYLGVPYQWGGTDPSTGLDCSGLVQRVMADNGITVPRVAAEQSQVGTPVASLADAQPGDLVFFGTPAEHVGIYVGNGKMLDAPHTGAQVRVEDVWGTPSSIRRVTSGSAATTSSATGVDAYDSLFQTAGTQYGVSPALLKAVASVESSGNASAVSGAGAEGLMQLMPSTAAGLGVNPFDPSQAVDGAAQLLSGYLKSEPSLSTALAAYNAGPGAVSAAGGQVPDIAETQSYVSQVEALLGSGA